MNIKQAQTQGNKEFVVVPEGKYAAKINKVEERQSEDTGNKFIRIALELLPSKKHQLEGKAVFENFHTENSNENAVYISEQRSQKLGKAVGMEILESRDLLNPDLLGKELLITVKNTKKEYNGENRTYANVTRFDEAV